MRHLWILILALLPALASAQSLTAWRAEFPKGEFHNALIPLQEIEYDGNTRDSIPPIYQPSYLPASQITDIGDFEPIPSIEIAGDARAYPLRIMLWHEIVNDTIGGQPVLITYCPLCNSGVVYDRTVDGQILDFGNTGRLRHLDMVMYDHQTESWWQQFSGRALIGTLAGSEMKPIASRLEAFHDFRSRWPNGRVLIPQTPSARPYGATPFAGMDSRGASRRYEKWPLPDGIGPLDYVVVVGARAWPLREVQKNSPITAGDTVLTWRPGRNSLHDTRRISSGRDLGSIEVTDLDGALVVHDLVFAFAFAAFLPDGSWMLDFSK